MILGMDQTTAIIVGAILVLVIVVAIVAISQSGRTAPRPN
jgi:hypothetical protein